MGSITLQLAAYLSDGMLIFTRIAPVLPNGLNWFCGLSMCDFGDVHCLDSDDAHDNFPMVVRIAIDLSGSAVVFLELDNAASRQVSIYAPNAQKSYEETGWRFLRAVEFAQDDERLDF